MEYTEQQKQEFKDAFAERRKRQWIVSIPFALLLFAFAFAQDRTSGAILGVPPEITGPILIGSVLVLVVFSFRNWRCPACNKYLGRAIHPKFCQNCGVALHD
jgi:hypothetical protein